MTVPGLQRPYWTFVALERCRRSVLFVNDFSFVQYTGPVNLGGGGWGADQPQLGAVLKVPKFGFKMIHRLV